MLESLPNRPITQQEVLSIANSDRVDMCKPLATLSENEQEPIVSVYLVLDGTVRVVGYIRNEGWEVITEFDEGSDVGIVDRAVDDLLEWSTGYYDPSEITLGTGESGVERTLLTLLPDRPLDSEEVIHFDEQQHEMDVVPVFAVEETGAVVCVLGFSMGLDGTLTSTTLGYTEDNGWAVIDTQAFSLVDELDPDLETAFEWADEEYGDAYVAIETAP